jgi:thiol:disulfide interchange protein/DsbC/DsbD-like thiol-disulfide interchange protein
MNGFSIIVTLFALAGLFRTGISAATVKTEHVDLELVSEWTALRPGAENTVAVRLKMDEHWHIYWENPGETGLATSIDWTLPEGVTAGPIQWPAPQWINYFDMVSYAYEGEVLLLVNLNLPDGFRSANPVEIRAKVDFLVCEEACIPGGGDLSLKLPIADSAEPTIWKDRIDSTRNSLPMLLPDWEMKVVDNGASFALTVLAPEGEGFDDRGVTYFSRDGWVAPSKPRTSLSEGRVLTIVMPKTEYEPEEGRDRFSGVLVSDSTWSSDSPYRALEVDIPFSSNEEVSSWLGALAGVDTFSGSGIAEAEERSIGFLGAVAFAFLGGILLNLMPCVFPVLSIKILGFVQQAGDDKTKVKVHGLVFTLGVLVSFWILAGLFLALRAAGQEIGWGFQLQTPEFVAVLASVLFLFGLNLSGVFEIGETLVGAGSGLQAKSGLTGSFFSGVLATVVATPCTAPFMGTALGIIITLSAIKSMMIFTALALGVALPYLLLSFFPAFLKLLPRPGAWMETFKKALAFLLYATVVWLVWVFGNQVGVNGMALMLMGLVVLGVAAWVWGNWGSLSRKKSIRRIALSFVFPILVVGGWLQYKASGFEAPDNTHTVSDSPGISWQTYSPEAVASLTGQGKTVYVDFTAKWCLTCQVNKKVAFGNADVIQYFKDNDIVALKGDWTRRDPVITQELQKFGRSGVPTNVIYRADGSSHLLPEVLTPSIVLTALKNL